MSRRVESAARCESRARLGSLGSDRIDHRSYRKHGLNDLPPNEEIPHVTCVVQCTVVERRESSNGSIRVNQPANQQTPDVRTRPQPGIATCRVRAGPKRAKWPESTIEHRPKKGSDRMGWDRAGAGRTAVNAEELAVEQSGERQRVARVHYRVVQRVRVRVRPGRASAPAPAGGRSSCTRTHAHIHTLNSYRYCTHMLFT